MAERAPGEQRDQVEVIVNSFEFPIGQVKEVNIAREGSDFNIPSPKVSRTPLTIHSDAKGSLYFNTNGSNHPASIFKDGSYRGIFNGEELNQNTTLFFGRVIKLTIELEESDSGKKITLKRYVLPDESSDFSEEG